MAFLKLLLAFAPWLSFLIIARDSLFRLKLGLVTALVLSLVMGLARLHKGIILWIGLAFFSYATAAVVFFDDIWTVRHIGVLTNAALAAATWLTVVLKRPFTLDYAKEHTDPGLWENPEFIKTNLIITSVWGLSFTLGTLLAFGKMNHFLWPEALYEAVSYAFLVATALFTVWYPKHVRRLRATSQTP